MWVKRNQRPLKMSECDFNYMTSFAQILYHDESMLNPGFKAVRITEYFTFTHYCQVTISLETCQSP